MNTATMPPESRALLNGIPPELNIVMLYEDADAGRCAKRFSDKLLFEIGLQCECARNLWSFDVLAITNVRNAAAGIARSADLVIVSASGERELSPQVEKWLDMWVWLIDGGNPALVALFQNADGGYARKIRTDLRALAEKKRLPFFPQPTFEPSGDLVRTERENLAVPIRWHSNHAAADGEDAMVVPAGVENLGRVTTTGGRGLS